MGAELDLSMSSGEPWRRRRSALERRRIVEETLEPRPTGGESGTPSRAEREPSISMANAVSRASLAAQRELR